MFQGRGTGFLGSALTTAAGVAGGMVAGNALMNLFSGNHGGGGGGGFGGGFGSPASHVPESQQFPSLAQPASDGSAWASAAGGDPYEVGGLGKSSTAEPGGWQQAAAPDSGWQDAPSSDGGGWEDAGGGGSDDP